MKMHRLYYLFVAIAVTCSVYSDAQTKQKLVLNDSNYFETRGLNVLFFSNHYGLFGDEKTSGVSCACCE